MTNPSWGDKLGYTKEEKLNVGIQELRETPVPIATAIATEEAFNRVEVEEAARNSLDFLAALAMPTIFQFLFPDTYNAIWALLVKHIHKIRDFTQIALGFPRGFAKTTFLKLFVLYVILFTTKRFILYCGHSQDKADAAISDVMDFLKETNIIRVFGNVADSTDKDTGKLKKFSFRGRDIIIAAGTVFSVRGINYKNIRPDLIIFDDIQDKEDAKSEPVSASIEDNLYGTAMKAKSPLGCMFVFLANMYPTKHSLLRKIKQNPGWIKFIAGGILADGTSLWEDLQPIEQLIKEFQNDLFAGRPETFYAEVLNDENASVNHLVDLSRAPKYPYDENEIAAGKFIIIDPSGDKANADAVTVSYYEIVAEKIVARKLEEGRMSPLETVKCAIRMALSNNCNIIGIESNAYQATLGFWFTHVCNESGISGLFPVEVYSGHRSKTSRILDWFKSYMAGEFILHPDVVAQTHAQITSYNALVQKNVDGILDCHCLAQKMLAEHDQFIRSQGIIELQEYINIPVRSEIETSAF